ncbi:MAG: hypothetical protein ACREJX_11205, partial [Polyangiaceae bacterium]
GSDFTSQLSSVIGDQSGVSFIEKLLAQYAVPGTTTASSNTPAWLQPMWDQLVSAFGISSSGSGQLNFAKNIGQEWVSGAQGASSSQQSYTTLGNLLQQVVEGFQQNGSTFGSASTQVQAFSNELESATAAIKNMNDNLSAAAGGAQSTFMSNVVNKLVAGARVNAGAPQPISISITTGDINTPTQLEDLYNNIATRTQYAVISAQTRYAMTSPPI